MTIKDKCVVLKAAEAAGKITKPTYSQASLLFESSGGIGGRSNFNSHMSSMSCKDEEVKAIADRHFTE